MMNASLSVADQINTGSYIAESLARDYSEDIAGLDYNDLSDEVLVKLYLEKEDEWAFNEIVNRYGEKIHRLAYRITNNVRYADDLLQEVFITLVEKLHTFRQEAKFSTWLYRVAMHATLGFLRKQNDYEKRISLDGSRAYHGNGNVGGFEIRDWSYSIDKILIEREGMEQIEKAISDLPEKYRIVFHLRHVEGLSNPEVGKILELSLPAVKSRLHRARLSLRDKLSDYFHEWSEAV
jgi:RNA polymerase sigma-70 factor, ECF subfamily